MAYDDWLTTEPVDESDYEDEGEDCCVHGIPFCDPCVACGDEDDENL